MYMFSFIILIITLIGTILWYAFGNSKMGTTLALISLMLLYGISLIGGAL